MIFLDSMEHFTDFDFIYKGFLSLPLNENEKREIRNNKRRKKSFSNEEMQDWIEGQRTIYASIQVDDRLLLLSAFFTKEQIRAWEKDRNAKLSAWQVYDQSEVGKAENALYRKMADEEFKRYLKNNPDWEPPPF